jgi:integrase
MVAYRHGFRASELIALRWDQIDLRQGVLHVARLKQGSPSTQPRRGPELRALRAWKREQVDAGPYVFTSLHGGPMTRRTVHHVVAEAVKAAGIEFPVHPHMLRHATGFPFQPGYHRALALLTQKGTLPFHARITSTTLVNNSSDSSLQLKWTSRKDSALGGEPGLLHGQDA